jgi:hypothetical protein
MKNKANFRKIGTTRGNTGRPRRRDVRVLDGAGRGASGTGS